MTDILMAGSNTAREFITFQLAGQEFCVDVIKVREIRGWTPATPIPHAPRAMLGVINLRGLVLPIIDLSARIGFPPAVPSARHAVIVVEIGAHIVGLLVDGVSEILSIPETLVQPTPDIASEQAKRLVQGVISKEGRMISVISLDQLPIMDVVLAA